MTEEILYQAREGVATVVINRPEARNALTPSAIEALCAALERAGEDRAVRSVVLTGAGERAFCSGADMGTGERGVFEDPKSYRAYETRGGFPRLFEAMHRCPRPIVGKVRGHCLAGGFGVALACDLLVAGESASFGTPEVRRGLFPMVIFAEIVKNLPLKRAFELCLLGEPISARDAFAYGFLNQVVPDADLDGAVGALAGRLAALSPVVLGLGKRAAWVASDMTHAQALEFLRSQLSINLLTEDSAEGLRAFREKRPAVFRGE
jgi:enoyl-CoA hydratase/carnithine racemase